MCGGDCHCDGGEYAYPGEEEEYEDREEYHDHEDEEEELEMRCGCGKSDEGVSYYCLRHHPSNCGDM